LTTLSETELMGRFIGKEHPPGVLIGFLLRIRKDNSRKATPIALPGLMLLPALFQITLFLIVAEFS